MCNVYVFYNGLQSCICTFNFASASSVDSWVGIRRDNDSEPFRQITVLDNPEFLSYSPLWDGGEPSGGSNANCLNAKGSDGNYQLQNSDCSVSKKFICEIPGLKSPPGEYLVNKIMHANGYNLFKNKLLSFN